MAKKRSCFRNSKKERKRLRGSQTPGRQKPPCKISFMDKFFAKKSRAYKHNGYADWCEKCRAKN